MADRRENPKLKDFQIGCSWIPTTPAKPDSTRQQSICTNWQEKYSVQPNWTESGRVVEDFLQEAQSQRVHACSGSINPINKSGDFNTWQAGEASKSHVLEDNLRSFDTWQACEAANSHVYGEDLSIYDKFSMHDADKWTNVSFGDLLALAHSARSTRAENAVTQSHFVATNSTSSPHFHPQIEGCQYTKNFQNSLLPDTESLLGSKSDVELNSIPDIFTDGSSIPSRPYFDLNSPPRAITDAALSKSISIHFEPITPEKANKAEYRQESAMPDISIDEVHAPKDKQENKIAMDQVKGLQEKKEQSQLVTDLLCATTSTQLQENYKPDKGGIEEADLSKTPQQKPRRKKHRPKVIIEGQLKSTPKPSAEKPTVPQETTKVKRKYTRRKGVSTPLEGETNGTDSNKKSPNPKDTPVGKRKYTRRKGIEKHEDTMDEGATETTDLKTVRRPRSSCRRSLNFNLENQERDESSSCCPASNCGMESQEENFDAKDQSRITVQCRQGMEVMMEKNDMCIAYELGHAMNEVQEDCLSRPEMYPLTLSSHTKMDPQQNHMITDRSVCTRGKCQIVFSDVTHDKEANTVQATVNPDGQWTPKSPDDSLRSSTCLTPERQARGLKRQHMGTIAEAEQCTKNTSGMFSNSLQAYLAIFSQHADTNDGTPVMHFPEIYKKKRTEKVPSTSTSSLQYTVTAPDNQVRFERHPLRDFCTKQFRSRTNQGSSVAQCKATNLLTHNLATDGTQNEQQVFEGLLAFRHGDWIKKKRSKGPTRVRDLASLLEICEELPTSPGRAGTSSRIRQDIDILHEPYTCMEALVADTRSTMKTKKRSKRSMLINSTVQNLYNHHEFATESMGPPLAIMWKCMSPVDSIIEQLYRLDLNAESSQVSAQKQNAFLAYHMHYQERHLPLVPYQKGGAVVPFEGSFDQVRRRRPRPKVDLDDETTKVWKLLLENINSEGIDGTDDEKTKWWEEERRVFNGRADSFIARMHLVQGDRRFSPWKGSVIDSVIGVFLTQNVSDHLSSSAFMSLAARFPLESNTNLAELHEEKADTKIKEPEARVLDLDETSGLKKKVLNKPVCGEDAKMLQDLENYETRVVNSVNSSGNNFDVIFPKDSCGCQFSDISKHGPVKSHESAGNKSTSLIGDGRDIDDTLSSQTSVVLSQNSADSPIAQSTERTESCLLSTSEENPNAGVKPNRFTSSTSFIKLLQMAGTVLHGVYEKGSDKKMSDENGRVQSERLALNSQNEDHLDDPTFLAKHAMSCSKSSLCLAPDLGVRVAECFDLSQKNSKLSDTSSGKGLCAAETSGLSEESTLRTTAQKFTAVSFEEGQRSSPNAHSCNNDQIEINQQIVDNQTGQVPSQSLLQENNYKMHEQSNIPSSQQNLMDVNGSSSNSNSSRKPEHKEVNSNKNDPSYHPGKTVNGPKARGRIGKEKQNTVDWDGLRKQAQAGGRKRERTSNTMDSVNWDAVRCADVNEIAQTIKERGMNNVLAERIKEFLNRLVRDHGSIDMEWLRDVPPDKAKEYLLSIRGLGLKSVECVRLLTLHHLAFPVDTNVGRIAVRLGWVPLQPLPESLQLHLLELYPVLESIQKYLWPRLCKLDQRTLYELHYQMITFGKVFCTKSKPNCNACPMRGECRHFASAFASARLALPAPEEKSIVSATENKAADQNPMRSMNTLQLPLPQANQMDAKSGVSNSQPIIEEPATPEPIIEVPASPEPGFAQVPECDIENALYQDPDEIPTIQLNMEEFTHNLQKIMQQNRELQEGDLSKALVALTPEAASIPVPKLKSVSRLRTEHQVYELPDSHPLLEGLDKREPDDPCPYLLAIWTPGETANSIEPPERQCNSQESEKLCTDETCLSCNSVREANSQTVRGTLLIPCRTAMRGSFPLNGTYFQVNEVFSDHESSLAPMDIPRQWLWNLPRRTVYFGTSIPTIFKGLSTEGIQYCFWRGFVCVRGFDRKTRAPRPLIARLHFPASKLVRAKEKTDV